MSPLCVGTASFSGSRVLRFVVQEHLSRTRHFDFRLERNGIFKSWAVPKGLPTWPGVKRLAVQVDDHPLEWGDFEGEIPVGEPGAGTVRIWDRGTYDLHEWLPDRISLTLYGNRLEGLYQLVAFRQAARGEWLIFKRSSQLRNA